MARHIHFIGIGGIGVSGVAQLALKQGNKVSGSDIKESFITQRLIREGAIVYVGHNAEHVHGADLIVHSSAIRDDNPELKSARQQGKAILKRAEFLAELMADKKVVTITGAHGKTTTSSLAAQLLLSAGFHPTVAVGGILREDGNNVQWGDSSYFVAEADESDGTFLCYKPLYSIITNIDYEHMDFYKSYDNLLDFFTRFVKQTKKNGCVFYCHEDKPLESIVQKSGVRCQSYGFSPEAVFSAQDISLGKGRLSFLCMKQGRPLGEISLGLMGRHNVLNALAVIALGDELRIDFQIIQKALSGFKGVERRFQVKFEDRNILIVDDYGHHPTEIAATIQAAKLCQRKRLLVVFQPHRFSRTQLLLDKFAQCFDQCDCLAVTDIYAAGESPIEGISAEKIVEKIQKNSKKSAAYVPKDQMIPYLKKTVQQDDLVLFLGAGDITKISDEFAKKFQE